MKLIDVLMYFLLTVSATAAGVCYSMAVETMRRKGFKIIWVFVLSILVTPFGAWMISLILREVEQPAIEADIKPEPTHSSSSI